MKAVSLLVPPLHEKMRRYFDQFGAIQDIFVATEEVLKAASLLVPPLPTSGFGNPAAAWLVLWSTCPVAMWVIMCVSERARDSALSGYSVTE